MENSNLSAVTRLRMFLQLVRVPNLLIIVITQFLLRYCLIAPFLYNGDTEFMTSLLDFSLVCLSTVLFTAGGYVINDYFDVKIDQVNKPDHLLVGKVIAGRTAIKWHIILTSLGSLIGLYLTYRIGFLRLWLSFPLVGQIGRAHV